MTTSVSENSSEKKRGRPRILSEERERKMRGRGRYKQWTRRGRLNEYYFFEGLSLFEGFDDRELIKRWAWLHYDTFGKESGERWRRTIVSEIGRLSTLQLMKDAADFLCERKPSAREAVNLIRQWRLSSG